MKRESSQTVQGNHNNTIQNNYGNINIVNSLNELEYKPKVYSQFPFYLTDDLIGRDDKLEQIESKLSNSKELVVINGIGGIGKTSLVLCYCNLADTNLKYKNKIWISITSSFTMDFITNISKQLGMKLENEATIDDNFQEVIYRLSLFEGNNLLVVDNLDNYEDFEICKKYLKNSPWKVIITTRCEDKFNKTIKVDELSLTDSLKLFCRFYKGDDIVILDDEETNCIHKILNIIDCHTLLIELIAKVSKSSQRKTLDEIYKHLTMDSIRSKKLQIDIPIGDHSFSRNIQCVNKINNYITQMFKLESLSKEELIFLRSFSIFPVTVTSLDIIIELFDIDEFSETEFENMLNKLENKGWIIRNEQFYKLHQLIQAVIIEELTPNQENCNQMLKKALEKISKKKNVSRNNCFPYLPIAISIIEKIGSANEITSDYYYQISDVMSQTGDFNLALEYSQKCLEIRTNILPYEHKKIAESLSQVGLRYARFNKNDISLEFQLKAFELRKTLYDKGIVTKYDLAKSFHNLGNIYRKIFRFGDSIIFHKKAIEIYKEKENGVNFSLGRSYNNLALTYGVLGQYENELDCFFKALAIYDNILDKSNSSFGVTYNNIASSYRNLKQLDKSLEFLLKSYNLRKEVFEPTHHKIAASYMGFAEYYLELKEYDTALDYALKAFEIRTKRYPELSLDFANVCSSLGEIYRNLKVYDSSMYYNKKALTIRCKIHSNKSLPVSNSLYNLAKLYLDLDAKKRALSCTRISLSIRNSFFSENHKKVKEVSELYNMICKII